ncbi:DUF1214 domain-containing protein [Roseibium sp. MMSF_3412]|uniref:DUF1214 domain-containing protein n=1 Tax=Roseibium sp. MMSF_3412 TaxID=3046712 RepID=UPI00273E92BF|nr:DUF1214 domain-containing protein [Roseibium sp. MMSF_3412]
MTVPSPASDGTGYAETDFSVQELPLAIRPHRSRPIRTLLFLTIIVAVGTLLGIGSAYVMIEREQPLNAVSIGAWRAYPKAGTAEADPYSVAIYTRGAVVPLASGEGLALVAREDEAGNLLDPTCVYRISGQTPAARLWTLTATDGDGRLTATLPGRVQVDSQNLLRNPDGSFTISAASKPHSGNWLPVAQGANASDGLRFVLRLYDAPVTTGAALDGISLPVIERVACP